MIALDYLRSVVSSGLMRHDLATLSPDGQEVLLNAGSDRILRAMTSWRDLVTTHGRDRRRIVKSLVREWERNGRLRFTILPPNVRDCFPGMIEEITDKLRGPSGGSEPKPGATG